MGVSAHHLDRADHWFARYGPVTVFFTRMMPGIRTFISLPAGIAKMPFAKFLIYSLLWLGHLERGACVPRLRGRQSRRGGPLGRLQETFSRYNRIFYVVLAVVVLALIGWGVWRWRRRRNRPAKSRSRRRRPGNPTAPRDSEESAEL